MRRLAIGLLATALGCSKTPGFGRYGVATFDVTRPPASCGVGSWSPDLLRTVTVDYNAIPGGGGDTELVLTRGATRVCRMTLGLIDTRVSEIQRTEACAIGPGDWPMRGLLVERDDDLLLTLGWTSSMSTASMPCAARLELTLKTP